MEKAYRLLIVDDQQRTRQSLKALLSARLPLEDVVMASNGLEAVRCVEASPPDLVIMDAQMPEMDGVEATRIIKTKYPHVKVVVLSLFATYREKALAAGADAFLAKQEPIELLQVACAAIADPTVN